MRKTSLDALSRNEAGVPVVGHALVESRQPSFQRAPHRAASPG